MSWDYEVVTEAREHTPAQIRALAVRLAKSYEATLVDHDDDDDDALEIHVAFPNGGGTIEIDRLRRGYRLHLDSQRDGNRDSWDDIGGFANDLAGLLGTVVDEELAAEMIAESEPDEDDSVEDVPAVAHVRVEDRAGAPIAELVLDEGIVIAAIDGAGILRDLAAHAALTEEGRYQLRVARIVATLHDTSGTAYRTHRWSCDGYGRIIGATVEDL